jgi:hypothetical protein
MMPASERLTAPSIEVEPVAGADVEDLRIRLGDERRHDVPEGPPSYAVHPGVERPSDADVPTLVNPQRSLWSDSQHSLALVSIIRAPWLRMRRRRAGSRGR